MMRFVALTIALALSAGPAQAKLISSATDSGSVPMASVEGWVEKAPWFEVAASPEAPVRLHIDVQCQRGKRRVSAARDLEERSPSLRLRVKLTIPDADRCHVSVTASYEDIGNVEGTITAKLKSAEDRP